ncbi:MAG: cyclic pyranopterin phosphate synthase MoaA [Deltaproteobacteria bacterium GWC2_42_11]|nr:MAG: cyclic pyranopterin phosphate synthase MoaA [Deltaproteobacteria bacterium GWC2_42_11]HBO83713.1 GTP 3',8-cyclase MoaA [Deltaproteobacteria bacterium]
MTRLIDTYNRSIDYLRISITDRCNLRCVYCMPLEGIQLAEHDNILRYEEFLRIVRICAAHGVKRIRLTGGEPLIRKGVVDFIRNIAGIKGIDDLSLTTNGVLLEEYARELKHGGLNRVNVSLDSLKKDRFKQITRADNLENVLRGLDEAERAGLSPVKVNIVTIKGFNDDEILDFALMTKKKPYHIRYIEYMPFDVGVGWQRDKCITTTEIKGIIERHQELIPLGDHEKRTGPARRYRFSDGIGEIGFISPVSDHFCGSCNRLRLTADGKLRTCLFSDDEIDVRSALRGGFSDKEIENILFNAVRKKPERHYINDNVFKKCSRTMSLIGG